MRDYTLILLIRYQSRLIFSSRKAQSSEATGYKHVGEKPQGNIINGVVGTNQIF